MTQTDLSAGGTGSSHSGHGSPRLRPNTIDETLAPPGAAGGVRSGERQGAGALTGAEPPSADPPTGTAPSPRRPRRAGERLGAPVIHMD